MKCPNCKKDPTIIDDQPKLNQSLDTNCRIFHDDVGLINVFDKFFVGSYKEWGVAPGEDGKLYAVLSGESDTLREFVQEMPAEIWGDI